MSIVASIIKLAFLFQFRLNTSAHERNPATEPLLPPQQNRFIISGTEHIFRDSRVEIKKLRKKMSLQSNDICWEIWFHILGN